MLIVVGSDEASIVKTTRDSRPFQSLSALHDVMAALEEAPPRAGFREEIYGAMECLSSFSAPKSKRL
jgi:hypothetical protein